MTKVRVLTKEEAAPWRLARRKLDEQDERLEYALNCSRCQRGDYCPDAESTKPHMKAVE